VRVCVTSIRFCGLRSVDLGSSRPPILADAFE
jgi:hypothetical protein